MINEMLDCYSLADFIPKRSHTYKRPTYKLQEWPMLSSCWQLTSVSFTWVESWLKKSISVSAMLMIQRVVRGGEIFSSGFLHSCLTSLHFWYLMIFFFGEDDGEEEMKREEAERLKSECFGWGGAVSKRQSLDSCSNFQHNCVWRYKLTAFFLSYFKSHGT